MNVSKCPRLSHMWEAVKLDRLGDKIDRYHSHDEFLRKCVTSKVTPISYQINLEPSVGNHDEAFIKGYLFLRYARRLFKKRYEVYS